MTISRKEVARLAGVSEATVSRVLNNVGPIKEETRQRVLRAAEQVGYVPNVLAQQFARKRSGNIGVILPFVPKVHLFSTYYFSEILSGIGETVSRFGYDLLLIFRQPDDAKDYAILFRTHKVDACIVLGSRDVPEERAALAELQTEGYPFCLVNQRFESAEFLTVDADHAAGSGEAVRHLIGIGRRRIAFLNGPPEYSNSMDRYAGYKAALRENGLDVREDLVYIGNYSRKSGYLLAEEIGKRIRGGEIDAVFAANDRMAIGLMQGLKEQGVEPGKAYSLVGYDDSDASRMTSPALSTVSVPFYEMGKLAAEKLLDPEQQDDRKQRHEHLLPIRFLARETSLI
ncbi:LacI family transcriptional regulator [Paenibacillus nanensis]|uniref:LacI family transcriptional regulator n=1 Tax=Paenibacillus nanensis TaxID=393251 RepID=A0A3A1UZD6_9BACL|nr:LacI family DNA-binding transcriptional regulator [Paenibacillus nanensis]RIX52811.1 LacI family transcriptional regulator [Paenibacillus nanensis]